MMRRELHQNMSTVDPCVFKTTVKVPTRSMCHSRGIEAKKRFSSKVKDVKAMVSNVAWGMMFKNQAILNSDTRRSKCSNDCCLFWNMRKGSLLLVEFVALFC